jgi:hypothetical protein
MGCLVQALSHSTDTKTPGKPGFPIPRTPSLLTRIQTVGRLWSSEKSSSSRPGSKENQAQPECQRAGQFDRGELGGRLGLHVESGRWRSNVDYRIAMTCRHMVLVHSDKSRRAQSDGLVAWEAIFWGSVERNRGVETELSSRLLLWRTLLGAPRRTTFLRLLRWWHLPWRRCYAFHRDMVVNAAGWCDYTHCKDKNFYK